MRVVLNVIRHDILRVSVHTIRRAINHDIMHVLMQCVMVSICLLLLCNVVVRAIVQVIITQTVFFAYHNGMYITKVDIVEEALASCSLQLAVHIYLIITFFQI